MRYCLAVALLIWSASANMMFERIQRRAYNASAMQELPDCAITCLDSVLSPQSCRVESPCFCESSSITADYNACISKDCSSTDWLIAQRFQAETCDLPARSNASTSRGVNWAFLVLGAIFVGLRVVSRTRLLNGSGFRWDDFVVVLSFAVLVVLHVSLEIATQNGLGQDAFLLSVSQITETLKWSYIGGVLFQSVVILSKIAIVLLYLRIWTTDSTKQALRIKCWVMVAVLVATVLAFDLAFVFQCWPISSTWTSFTEGPSSCIDREPLLYTFAGLNIFFNVVVFFMPIHSLRKLDIPWQKKAGVCSVFVMGFVVTVTSVVRLQYLVRLGFKDNVTWNLQYVFMWSVIEASISLICACMPSVTGLIQRCVGAEPAGSSEDLIAQASGTTQKRLLRHGNSFYTVDRTSTEAATRGLQDEIVEIEKAQMPDHFQGIDIGGSEDQPRLMENEPEIDEKFFQEGDFNNEFIPADEDAMSRNSAISETSRPRLHQFKNQATEMAALLYRSKVSGRPKKVEISHDPPSEPSEARMTYRDEDNVLHEVTVTDIPQPQVGPFHSGHGVRPNIMRAITEADSRRTSKYTSGEFASPVYSPMYSPASPGFNFDQNMNAERIQPQMVSASSQTDLFEPHDLSPIRSMASSPSAGRNPGSIRPSLSSRSMSTQTDEQSLPSLASRTSSPAGNSGLLTSPMVLSRSSSEETQGTESLPSPPAVSPGVIPVGSPVEQPVSPRREFRTAMTQIDDVDAKMLSPKLIHIRSPHAGPVERLSSPPTISQHTSTQTLDFDSPIMSPLLLASPLASPISPPSETSFVGLAALPSISLTAGTQTDDNNSTPGSPLSSRRSSSTQTIGFLGLDSKRRLGI